MINVLIYLPWRHWRCGQITDGFQAVMRLLKQIEKAVAI
ncbi:hypothetical protein SPFL3102_02783 [Sporomusaceae bacterium FL31]|nr:hypothetical protein SPFL3101_01113 [Sporomusaceae bacterium FL31]GCE34955.1 hypothetical protein SPFL3102_02783 [Sporomusaceae bacterium]